MARVPVVREDGFDAPGADARAAIARFRSPLTRMLLSGDGLTTTLLEAWAGAPVRARDVRLRAVRPEHAPRGAVGLLGAGGWDGLLGAGGRDDLLAGGQDDPIGAGGQDDLLVRCSTLVDARGRVLSLNEVVAAPGADPALRRCLTDASAPLGPALRAAGAGLRRTVMDAGITPWPHGAPAAFRTYRLWCDGEVRAVVREVFNPAHVPATLRERDR